MLTLIAEFNASQLAADLAAIAVRTEAMRETYVPDDVDSFIATDPAVLSRVAALMATQMATRGRLTLHQAQAALSRADTDTTWPIARALILREMNPAQAAADDAAEAAAAQAEATRIAAETAAGAALVATQAALAQATADAAVAAEQAARDAAAEAAPKPTAGIVGPRPGSTAWLLAQRAATGNATLSRRMAMREKP